MAQNNPMPQRVLALILGLVINALGNGLTVATNMGTSPWTASEVNLGHLFGTTVGWPMLVVGVLTAVINQLLIRHWDTWRFVGEVAFISCFSYFVNTFVAGFTRLGVPDLPVIPKIVVCLLGVVTFCCAISLYQRANLIMHPNDDTTNILRFLYFNGRVMTAQIVNFLVSVAIIILTVLFTHRLYSVNIGTLFCLLGNGPLIGLSDRYIWPGLRHNFRVSQLTGQS
ncbi:YczE/YyaS/YitT family protein [Levilactobacillus namurensis]|uniref:YczE/YyaS/YitT family protein n=1 Tax=Levilactobacillus namurensis TaxID=380393 RepID=UPI001D4A2913|nr:hypothetical protein [Levilactobacillus namurensis]HJE45910.1 hypothetical protein [Levilactobacillus namurensis]